MKELFRLFFMVLVLVAVVLAAAQQRPELVRDVGVERWDVDALADFFFQGPEQPDPLPLLAQRFQAKHLITQELIANRATLSEAVAAFRRLDDDQGTAQNLIPAACGCSTEEDACRQVIHWVTAELEDESPAVAEEVIRRLEDQYNRQLERREGMALSETANNPFNCFHERRDGVRSATE